MMTLYAPFELENRVEYATTGRKDLLPLRPISQGQQKQGYQENAIDIHENDMNNVGCLLRKRRSFHRGQGAGEDVKAEEKVSLGRRVSGWVVDRHVLPMQTKRKATESTSRSLQ